MNRTPTLLLAIFSGTLLQLKSGAQLTVTGQLRTRSELRDGFGAPLPQNSTAAFFTSQRTRLLIGYTTHRLKLGIALQDVRVWGQDASSVNRTTSAENNGLLAHEAWAEIALLDTFVKNKTLTLKLGRQELAYDDQRLLGNLDWLQQGRRHDAAVLKLDTKKINLHTGVAFNQNKENVSGTLFNNTPPGYAANTNGGAAYKSFQFIHAGYKIKKGTASFLLFADQFSKYAMSPVNSVVTKVYQQGVWNRVTTGVYLNTNYKKLVVSSSAYYQFGKNATGQQVDAALLSLSTQFNVNKKLSTGPGFDYTTGGGTSAKSNAFDPLYGTPHKFWGLMDYFYVGSGFGNTGLADYYLKTKYKASTALQLTADVHRFYSSSNVYTGTIKNARRFGTEVDFTANYTLTKTIGFEAGYSHFFSTTSLALVKNIINAQKSNNWAYFMINIKPDFLSK